LQSMVDGPRQNIDGIQSSDAARLDFKLKTVRAAQSTSGATVAVGHQIVAELT
jgi:hypothetical protein